MEIKSNSDTKNVFTYCIQKCLRKQYIEILKHYSLFKINSLKLCLIVASFVQGNEFH